MQACILAGGRGTRMKELTATLPKTLLPVGGTPILLRTLQELPSAVTHIVLVIGYLGDKVKNVVGDSFNGRPVTYVPLDALRGTAYALHRARPALLPKERFLVLNGDDLYSHEDIEQLLQYPLSIGIKPLHTPASRYLHIALRTDGTFANMTAQEPGQKTVNVATGAYVLNFKIFEYEPVPIANGELGLPHTIARMAANLPVHGVMMDHWLPLTSPEDIKNAEEYLRVHPLSTS